MESSSLKVGETRSDSSQHPVAWHSQRDSEWPPRAHHRLTCDAEDEAAADLKENRIGDGGETAATRSGHENDSQSAEEAWWERERRPPPSPAASLKHSAASHCGESRCEAERKSTSPLGMGIESQDTEERSLPWRIQSRPSYA